MKWSNKVHKLTKCSFHHTQHVSKDLFGSLTSIVTQCVRSWYFHNTCLVSDSVFLAMCLVSIHLNFSPNKFLDTKTVSNNIGKVFLQTPCLWKDDFQLQSHISVKEGKNA